MVGKEIRRSILRYENDYSIDRISLVGYSLGGLIFRAALPHIEKYK